MPLLLSYTGGGGGGDRTEKKTGTLKIKKDVFWFKKDKK
jgi:hypothetical protein